MNPKNTKLLFKTFPKLYENKDLDPSQSLMCFGFECGDGWYNIIFALSKIISEISPDTKASQVKEKFGELRFYCESTNREVHTAICLATEMSRLTCENCGTTKNVFQNKKGWIHTLCSECRKNR